jgi:hypothetical protein
MNLPWFAGRGAAQAGIVPSLDLDVAPLAGA